MTFPALAKALRRQLLRRGLMPAELVHAMPDTLIVEGFTHCAACRQSRFADPRAAVANAESPAEFLQLVDLAKAAHVCPAQQAQRN